MRTLTLVVIAVLLTGCPSLPSMQYCSEVIYERKGTDITVTAKCQLPVGGSTVGVPIPAGL